MGRHRTKGKSDGEPDQQACSLPSLSMEKTFKFQGAGSFVVFGYVKAPSLHRARTNQTEQPSIMKTKFTLFFATLAFAGISYGGPSESANYAIRHAQELANRANAPVATTSDTGSYRIATAPSGKGVVRVPNSDSGANNIALFKSSKKGACDSGSCCAKMK